MNSVRRIPIALALVCVLLSAVSAYAQNGKIAGTLTEDGTGIPLHGIPPVYIVTAYNANTGDAVGASFPNSVAPYEIDLPPGQFYVKVTFADEHVLELHPDIPCIAPDCTLTAGTPVTVTANNTTTVDFSLAKEGKISGTVRRAANNSGIAMITVEIYNANTSLVAAVNTDANGAYAFAGLAAGTYFARTLVRGESVVGKSNKCRSA